MTAAERLLEVRMYACLEADILEHLASASPEVIRSFWPLAQDVPEDVLTVLQERLRSGLRLVINPYAPSEREVAGALDYFVHLRGLDT